MHTGKWLWEKEDVVENAWGFGKWITTCWQNWTQVNPLLTGSGPEQACDVTVVNGKDASQCSTPFTYSASLTPLIDEIVPKRGGTAGGTRLSIKGSGFRYCLHRHTSLCVCFQIQAICTCFLICQGSAYIHSCNMYLYAPKSQQRHKVVPIAAQCW